MNAKYPFYISEPSSTYEESMQRMGFTYWARLKESNKNFYRLLGWALLHHCYYDSHQYKRWKKCIESVSGMIDQFRALSPNTPEAEIVYFWGVLKHNTLDEAKKIVRFSDTIPGADRVKAGWMPNLEDLDTLKMFTGALSIVLVWYELRDGIYTTRWFYADSQERDPVPLFYICMGRENTHLYAFLHQNIWTEGGEGFPYFTRAEQFCRPPTFTPVGEIPEENGLALILNLLVRVLTEVPPHLIPIPQRRQLQVIAASWHLLLPQLQQASLAKNFDLDKCGVLLQHIRDMPEAANHQITDCSNLHPPDQLLPCGANQDCLANYLRELRYLGQPLQFPNGSPVPEDLLRQIAPDLLIAH